MSELTVAAALGPVATSDDAPEVRETHSGLVLFSGDRVYKFKKAVSLGFLDFTTPEARLRACQEEVRLNRRLSPDVYLGVASSVDEANRPFDHAVVMRRLPSGSSLQARGARGEDLDIALGLVAHRVAALHAASLPAGTWSKVATASFMLDRWKECFDVLRRTTVADHTDLDRLAGHVDAYLSGREHLFEERVRSGHIVDGHGDLQCADIFVVDGDVQILDCIEFDESLRWGDGLLDAAFLAMDLERLGHPAQARSFLDRYGELLGDSWPRSLADHYIAYRAIVRAKVTALRAGQRGEAVGSAIYALVAQAEAHIQRSQCQLVLVGGLPGTGKTTTAHILADSTGAVVLSSDEARDAIVGGNPAPSTLDGGRYTPAARDRVYRQLLADASSLLAYGEDVILDASWSDAAKRQKARIVADVTHSAVVEVRCTAPATIAESRILNRLAVGDDRSEATPEVARAMARRFDPWPESHATCTAND